MTSGEGADGERELDADILRVYQLRVTNPTDGLSRLAARAGLTPEEAARAEVRLLALGLLQRSPSGGWVAIDPESAADHLLAPVEQEILEKRIAMAATREQLLALSGDYVEARSLRSIRSSIENVAGIDNIRAVVDDLVRTCAGTLDVLVPGGGQSEAGIRFATPLDLDLLARGVRIRALFQHTARRHRATLQYMRRIASAGAEVRSSSTLPARMQIYDRECAVLPIDQEDTGAGVAIVRDPAILAYVSRVFDQCWADGTDVAEHAETPCVSGPSGTEREVLHLLAEGRTNEEIARLLGLSQRSVSRTVAALMARLDAGNRFQAGAAAVLRGWLD
ncbi:helix-turn-helix transcriptional regulator [Streptomyces sp. RFCAC02]|uniref:helix-turn-helix transcriptional regulator n=1 Tax=Streptomyces sp. RFCAC02 TaxID=2499143 RepID=UPI0010220670|nr:helix-turn-helix transcriptional regulator [Streptomyces sp. RFCAC02]